MLAERARGTRGLDAVRLGDLVHGLDEFVELGFRETVLLQCFL